MPDTFPLKTILKAMWQFGWLALLILCLGAARGVLWLYGPRIKGWLGERRVKAVLDRSGLEHLHDVFLPTRDGVTQIDHVVRLPGALLVVETKNYSGLVLADPGSARWTQVLAGGRSRLSFQNPLRQNHGHVLAVRNATDGRVPVVGLVVFVGKAMFGRNGEPEGVVTLRGLGKALNVTMATHPQVAGMNGAWLTLKETIAAQDRGRMARIHVGTREAAAARAGTGRKGPSRGRRW